MSIFYAFETRFSPPKFLHQASKQADLTAVAEVTEYDNLTRRTANTTTHGLIDFKTNIRSKLRLNTMEGEYHYWNSKNMFIRTLF